MSRLQFYGGVQPGQRAVILWADGSDCLHTRQDVPVSSVAGTPIQVSSTTAAALITQKPMKRCDVLRSQEVPCLIQQIRFPDYVSELRPSTGLLLTPQMIYEHGESRCNDIYRG
jgi:hypothetical protein